MVLYPGLSSRFSSTTWRVLWPVSHKSFTEIPAISTISQTAIKGQFAMILIATTPQDNSLSRLKGDFAEMGKDLDHLSNTLNE